MHVVYVHKNFPAQFGHIAVRLIQQHGFRCSFVTEQPAGDAGRIERILYKCPAGATRSNHVATRGFETCMWRSHAVLNTFRSRADIRPDLIVGHSGFGSTLFLRDFYSSPIINFCEWFYRPESADTELLHRRGRNYLNRLTDRCRDAVLLADLDACTLGYSPTNWQRSRIPNEYQHKLETIFDGIDTSFWRPLSRKERGRGRWIAGKWIPWRKRVVTYVSRGFESMRGFDVFMRVAQRICERRKDVVFLCIGSDRVCYGGDLSTIPEKSFREHVLKHGSYDLERFIFTGPIPQTELCRAFALSDLHIYLTAPFILSWSLMDALACGCPVLVSDTPPLREVIDHGRNGLMAPYFDIDRYVELALEVLDDPAAYRRTLGEAGMATIHEKYSLDVVLPQMIRLYERAIAGNPLGAGPPTPPKPSTAGLRALSNGIPRESRIGAPPVPSTPQDSDLTFRRRVTNWFTSHNGQANGERGRESFFAAANDRPQAGKLQLPRTETPDPLAVSWLSPAEQTTLQRSIPRNARLILELGAWRGETTAFLAEHCPNARILAVDTWHGGNFPQPLHPEWKAMLPEIWESFVERTRRYGDRITPIRQRHEDAVREIAARGEVPDVIYYDPDYNSDSLRRTLVALVRAFPTVRLIGHDWLWHRVQQEVSLASRQSGRKLDSRGNLWHLAPASVGDRQCRRHSPTLAQGGATPVAQARVGAPHTTNPNGVGLTSAAQPMPISAAPLGLGRNHWLSSQGSATSADVRRSTLGCNNAVPSGLTREQHHTPLRVLVTIPHYYRPNPSRFYGSATDARDRRVAAVRACLTSIHETLAGVSYTANLARPENLPANSATAADVHVVVCTSGKDQLLDDLDLPSRSFETHQVGGDPLFLGYACHAVLRERLGEFDCYAYMEDDLVLGDPWIFAKLRWFGELAGDECVLQPNRFELSRGIGFQPVDATNSYRLAIDATAHHRLEAYPTGSDRLEAYPTIRKCYIDGDLDPDKTARYQNVTDRSELAGEFLGQPVLFRRPPNPHSGCFFLTQRQMRCWSDQPYFLDRDATFYSPLEGAATVGIMRTFRTYKPARENASFLEIRHMGDAWLNKLARRDESARARPALAH